jgi:hypothetical protein
MLTLVVVRGLDAWRSIRSLSRAATSALDVVTREAASAERLSARVAHLQTSLERLGVLQDAAGDVRGTVSVARGALPRK